MENSVKVFFGNNSEYVKPSLDFLMSIKEKENKTPVLSIEFSSKGKILAISYG